MEIASSWGFYVYAPEQSNQVDAFEWGNFSENRVGNVR